MLNIININNIYNKYKNKIINFTYKFLKKKNIYIYKYHSLFEYIFNIIQF